MIDQATATLAVAGASVVASIVALIIGWRQGTAARLSAAAAKASAEAAGATAGAAGHREIAKMRLEWLRDLRRLLAEYHSILQTYAEADHREVAELGTHLDLMLNLNESDQHALWQVADQVFHAKDREERIALDKPLMAAGRTVLKAEWEKIKRELRGSTDS